MKINYKKGLVVFSAFLFSTMNTAFAGPQNMQLKTESTLNANGQKVIINSTVWYGSSKVRMENDIAPTKGVPANLGKSTIIYDSAKKVVYMMMPQNKTAIKADSSTLNSLQAQGGAADLNTQLITNPGEIRNEMKKQGGKMVGAETILGYLCDVWQMESEVPVSQTGIKEPATVKVWIANKLSIPLKMEIISKQRGKVVSVLAKEIKTNITIPNSTFEVPSGYKITDVQQMMNQMKKQVPATKTK